MKMLLEYLQMSIPLLNPAPHRVVSLPSFRGATTRHLNHHTSSVDVVQHDHDVQITPCGVWGRYPARPLKQTPLASTVLRSVR
ncbi:hypothetical protein IAQ61_010438 [Plenodomus lingam]|uniref:uncharacterized protein n=1 Tax=Leptosphaeria maculans TaxID=5022 RepID=UPI00331A99D1|nr:hypothetical protein IAQ61_010438 [Plenodomus lingam]